MWAPLAFAQQSTSNKPAKTSTARDGDAKKSAELNLRLDRLIQLARSASPEVAADVLLTIVSSKLVAEKKTKIDLIEDALRLASQVREPVRRKSTGLAVDTKAGYKEMAFDLGLDKLSLQSKAVAGMIQLDSLRARTMFGEISPPAIKPLTCEDSLVYDLDSYYQAMLSIAEQSFSNEEKKNAAHIQFLSDRLEEMNSVAQVTSGVKVILNAKTSADELALLARVFAKALDRISTDPRSFAYLMDRDSFVSSVQKLILKLKERELPTNDLANATKRFLLKNMTGDVCADAGWIKRGQPSLPAMVEHLNADIGIPITTDDIRPASFGPRATDVSYWSTPKSKAILKAAKELRFGGGTQQLTPEQRQTEEWSRKLRDLLELIDDWDSGSEASEDDYFQQKCNTYRLLVDLCPDDLQRDSVLRAYGGYLDESNRKYKGRIEWILQVKEYLRALRWKSAEMQKSSLEPWLSANDASLQAYGELTLLMNAKI